MKGDVRPCIGLLANRQTRQSKSTRSHGGHFSKHHAVSADVSWAVGKPSRDTARSASLRLAHWLIRTSKRHGDANRDHRKCCQERRRYDHEAAMVVGEPKHMVHITALIRCRSGLKRRLSATTCAFGNVAGPND